ncbi:hypothetical protein FOZG_12357 [Fusarium oxysporum Fo47]|uniref:Uncharacterized protein n=1 Tax=Fusarium oxysporum Fo47 TaxID=660027 RepID=W9JQT5_FUSOX|nr:hypothetical protein FOZG_12357 [Fusarium oxysporum Fo47]
MLRTFPNIRPRLIVGIGGGAPSPKHDIRLGDVVVSVPFGAKGGVLHHECGKKIQKKEFQFTGSLNQPPQFLLTAVGILEADYEGQGHELNERIENALSKRPRLRKRYAHPLRLQHAQITVAKKTSSPDDDDDSMIHYGLIASSDKLMKNATIRDELAREEGALCFEMEAAGLMNHFLCLIIRGIRARNARALSEACEAGSIEIARLLLSERAKADYKSTELEAWVRSPSPYNYNELECYTFSECSLVSAAKSGNEHLVQMLLDNVFDLSRVVGLRQESKVTTSIYVKKAFVAALKGCHQRVITTLLEAMVNHAHTDEYATLSAVFEIQTQHILREFSAAIDKEDSPPFLEIMNHLHEILLGDHKHIF